MRGGGQERCGGRGAARGVAGRARPPGNTGLGTGGQGGEWDQHGQVGPLAARRGQRAAVERPAAQLDQPVGPTVAGAAVVVRAGASAQRGERGEQRLAALGVEHAVDHHGAVERARHVEMAAPVRRLVGGDRHFRDQRMPGVRDLPSQSGGVAPPAGLQQRHGRRGRERRSRSLLELGERGRDQLGMVHRDVAGDEAGIDRGIRAQAPRQHDPPPGDAGRQPAGGPEPGRRPGLRREGTRAIEDGDQSGTRPPRGRRSAAAARPRPRRPPSRAGPSSPRRPAPTPRSGAGEDRAPSSRGCRTCVRSYRKERLPSSRPEGCDSFDAIGLEV